MEKNQAKQKAGMLALRRETLRLLGDSDQKASPLVLRKETLLQLKKSELQRVAGGTRIRIPIGFGDDTSPIYGDEEAP